MQKYYNHYDSIDRLTLSLGYHETELECVHCLRGDQFVSHGIIYKQRSSTAREKVGKRIFCSNRYNHSGCGRTFQLYVSGEIPSLHYNAVHVFAFILSLLANMSIEAAYSNAIKQENVTPRNAWRWRDKLVAKLTEYRIFLAVRTEHCSIPPERHPSRLKHLLPSLSAMVSKTTSNLCMNFQRCQQNAFI